MNRSFENLQALVDLAKEKSSTRRRQLLREVTDLFLEGSGEYSRSEIANFDDVLCAVTDEVNEEDRVDLAKKMSNNTFAPKNLIGKLAHDDIPVAQPILEHSPVLSENDLLSVIDQHGQRHMSAITKRETISARVSDAIVDKGEDPVVADLLKNEGAETTRATMEKVVARAFSSEILQQPTVMRQDIPLDLLNELFFDVDKPCQDLILEKTARASPEEIAVFEELIAKNEYEPFESINDGPSAEKEIQKQKLSGNLAEGDLVTFLLNSEMEKFRCAFACLTGLDTATATRITSDAIFESLVVACKASGFERGTFSTMMMLLDEDKDLTNDDMMVLLDLYERLDNETAMRTVRFWRIRKAACSDLSRPKSTDAA